MLDWIIQNDKWEHMFYSSDGMEIHEVDLKAIKEGRYKLIDTGSSQGVSVSGKWMLKSLYSECQKEVNKTWIVYMIEIKPYFFMPLPHLLKVEVYAPIDIKSQYREERIDLIIND